MKAERGLLSFDLFVRTYCFFERFVKTMVDNAEDKSCA